MMIGNRIHIPAGLDRDGIEHYRQMVQEVLEQKHSVPSIGQRQGGFLKVSKCYRHSLLVSRRPK